MMQRTPASFAGILAAFAGIAALVMLCAGSGNALAQSYPARPVTVIVPFPPGGTTDVAARIFAAGLGQKVWNQSVVIENRPGGNLTIGAGQVARATPDGYTLLMAANSLTYEHLITKDTPFNAQRDLTPISVLVGSGIVFAAPPSFKPNTFAELIAYARANPGKLNHGRIAGNIEFDDLWPKLGIEVTNVAYKGGANALSALLAGEVDTYAHSPGEVARLVKQGRLKALAYTYRVRHPLFPDLPTLDEILPGYSYRYWFGLWGPAGLPANMVTRINADARQALSDPDTAGKINGLGLQIFAGSPEDMQRDVAANLAKISDQLAKGYQGK